jgi:hypothetical protein
MDLMDQLHDIDIYIHQHLKVASNREKACNDCLASSTEFDEGDVVWLYCLTET